MTAAEYHAAAVRCYEAARRKKFGLRQKSYPGVNGFWKEHSVRVRRSMASYWAKRCKEARRAE